MGRRKYWWKGYLWKSACEHKDGDPDRPGEVPLDLDDWWVRYEGEWKIVRESSRTQKWWWESPTDCNKWELCPLLPGNSSVGPKQSAPRRIRAPTPSLSR